jgi:hypothetical protein
MVVMFPTVMAMAMVVPAAALVVTMTMSGVVAVIVAVPVVMSMLMSVAMVVPVVVPMVMSVAMVVHVHLAFGVEGGLHLGDQQVHPPLEVQVPQRSLPESHCVRCDWSGPTRDVFDRVRSGELDPACPDCGGILKPRVVFFGEALVEADIARALDAAGEADLLLAVGMKGGAALAVAPVAEVAAPGLGGILLGVIESIGSGYLGDLTGGFLGSQYKDIFAFLVLILVLVFRPSGLMGERVAERA